MHTRQYCLQLAMWTCACLQVALFVCPEATSTGQWSGILYCILVCVCQHQINSRSVLVIIFLFAEY